MDDYVLFFDKLIGFSALETYKAERLSAPSPQLDSPLHGHLLSPVTSPRQRCANK